MITEEWKLFNEFYMVSNFGNVKTIGRNVFQKHIGDRWFPEKSVAITDNGRGYKLFSTAINKKRKNYYLHRVVADLFIPNPNAFPEVNHKDANKSNNHVSNLEWVSVDMNRHHAVVNDLVSFGENSHYAKLTECQVIEILSIHKENPSVNRVELAKKYGVRDTAICRIIAGKRWRRTHNKFHTLKPIHL